MAFLQSHGPRQPVLRAPAVVIFTIGFLVLAHVARTLLPPALSQDWLIRLAFIPARYSPHFLSQPGIAPVSLFDQALPFIGYIALHASYTHLAINCLWLLAFAPIVARRFGPVLFLAFFLLCGIAGAATYLACDWGSPMPMIGASGAISGLMGAALRLLPTERRWGGAAELAPIWSRQIVIFTLVWVGINLVAGETGITMVGEPGAIAWQAHLGGYAAGLLLAAPFDWLRPPEVGAPL